MTIRSLGRTINPTLGLAGIFPVVMGLTAAMILGSGLLAGRSSAFAAGTVIPIGDVMVSIGNAQVQVHKQDGSIDTAIGNNGILNDGSGTSFTTGSAFDGAGNFYVTDLDKDLVSKFDPTGVFLNTFGSGYSSDEDLLFDGSGNVYVGNVASGNIIKFDPSGNTLATFLPAQHRVDWIDLAADQCTILYTTEGINVFSFNVCTSTDLANFNVAQLPGSSAFALRITPSGDVLVADSQEVVRLNSSGTQIQTYPLAGEGNLFSLNLDPDGTSFWTADFGTADVLKVDIATGNTLVKFNTGTGGDTVFGLSVKGEITVGGKPTATIAVSPPPVNVKGAPGQTVGLGTFTLTNTSSLTETFTTVTINLNHASVLSSLSLSGTFDESTTSAQTNSPKASNVLTLSTPVVLDGGQVATFTAQGKIGAGSVASLTGVSGLAMAAVVHPEIPGSGTSSRPGNGLGLALVLGTILLAGSLKLRLPVRSAMFAMVAILMMAGSMSCDPCASCSGEGGGSSTTTVTVQTVTGTDTGGTAVKVTGVPAALNSVTRT
jgi:streptogramin lyase